MTLLYNDYVASGESLPDGDVCGSTVQEALLEALYKIDSDTAGRIVDDGWQYDIEPLIRAIDGHDVGVYRCGGEARHRMLPGDSLNWAIEQIEATITDQHTDAQVMVEIHKLEGELQALDGAKLDFVACIDHGLYWRDKLRKAKQKYTSPQNGGTQTGVKSATVFQHHLEMGEMHSRVTVLLTQLMDSLCRYPQAQEQQIDLCLKCINLMGHNTTNQKEI